jgi:pyruvate dehydrogenase E2 component (dihydrolipoamide acetyltransferase)
VKSKYDFYGTLERIPLRGIRRATAKKMHESVSTAAHVTHFDEADAAALAALKDKLAAEAARFGVKLTYLPFIVKALIAAIKLHPTLNSTLDDEEQEIVVKKYYNIGIAVDVPDGLIVPVVKIAEQKTVFDIAGEIKTLAEAAKARTLDMGDLRGGTFSITNVGMIGGEWATPIINYPEVAILATMKIADRVRAVGGTVAVRKTLPLCLSFDHRVIDGAEAARFMNDLKKALEDEALLESAARAAE